MPQQEIQPTEVRQTLGPLLTPLSLRGIPRWAVVFLALLSLVYILNPTAGVLEFLPDNLPFIGNLDEGVAFTEFLARKLPWLGGDELL